MVILSVENISKTVKDEPLFQDVTFGMQRGEKIGLVGPNGCGKSTFLRVLGGRVSSDSGTIAKARALSVSMLESQPNLPDSGGRGQGAYQGEWGPPASGHGAD